jgi:polyribonucleotide nucleotidyltransferase
MITVPKEFSIDLAGRKLSISVGQLAQQANGSCVVRYGDTVALCTATLGEAREDAGFFPLSVDFEERLYAAGRIKGSRFIKREGRPTDEAVLSGRLIDRAIRPLFPHNLRNEVAVVTTVLSHDQENDADVPGLIGSACALAISNIPWNGPIAAVRIGRKEGKLIVMPTYSQTDEGELDLVVAGTADKTIMVEAGANIVPEAIALEAMKLALSHLGPIIDLINQVCTAVGKQKKLILIHQKQRRKLPSAPNFKHCMIKSQPSYQQKEAFCLQNLSKPKRIARLPWRVSRKK